MSSNFDFLKEKFPALANFGNLAEKYLYSDSNSSLIKLGMMGETIVNLMIKYDDISVNENATAVDKIRILYMDELITKEIKEILHITRKYRNKAAHENFGNVEMNKSLLKLNHRLTEWFMQTYGDWDYKNQPYILPLEIKSQPKADLAKEETRENKLIQKAEKVAEKTPAIDLKERKRQAWKSSDLRNMTEAETRFMIDEQLREVGWEADTENLRHAYGTRPEKGKNLAIAEWPTDSLQGNSGYVDYALFIGERMVGIIEAKSYDKDIYSIIDSQCKEYASSIKEGDAAYLDGSWGKYQIPFVFSTNGRPYNKQFEMKSGVWFSDLRNPAGTPEALHDWFSPMGIEELLETDLEEGNQKLKDLSYDLLKDENGLNLREYQLRAIEKTEEAVIHGQKNILLAMATGTGKTRTILGMIYRFLKTDRFRRILFLVDRTALGIQAQDVFKEVKLEELMTLDEIYNINEIEDQQVHKETRIQVATVQGMVKRILYNESGTKPTVSDFDLIIVDEAHRGYTLDREMTEEEELYRDQRDYQSKYRAVIDYFKATKIGLTATPALHTTEIFGEPVYKYSYREAVIDGYLVDHDVPHKLTTRLSSEGIKFTEGQQIPMIDPVTGEVVNSEVLVDEVQFDVSKFNKEVIVEDFNRVVLEEIAKDIDPENREEGKTLIYAVNDQHADLIVKLLRDIYKKDGVDGHAIQKITGKVGDGSRERVQEAIKHFKNEQFPSIAVTVDLLTTGIDVPEITRIVFMRRVKSRILFEQMIGRATRLCPRIGKTHFDIYDPVSVYESLSAVNTMKPLVKNPKRTLSSSMEELEEVKTTQDKGKAKYHVDQIVGKLQRKSKNIDETSEKYFLQIGKKTPLEFIQEVEKKEPLKAVEYLLKNRNLVEIIENAGPREPYRMAVSTKKDELLKHERGYGKSTKPEDYIEEFQKFIHENENKITAIKIICTKPSDLTREDLKELRMILDQNGFTTTSLNTAFSQMTNEEITADLISIIRKAALGSHLISHEERVKIAIEKLKKSHDFTKTELNWIIRIEKYILNESIINIHVFDEDKRFKRDGGLRRMNNIFDDKLEAIIEEINDYLYTDGGIA